MKFYKLQCKYTDVVAGEMWLDLARGSELVVILTTEQNIEHINIAMGPKQKWVPV